MADSKKLAQLLMGMQSKLPSNDINQFLTSNQPVESDLVNRSPYNPMQGGNPNAQSFAPTPFSDKLSAMPRPGETQEQFNMRLRNANPINPAQYLTY